MTAPKSKVERLQSEASTAATVRALTTHPDVIALRVEKIRAQVDRLIWAGMLLGLAFTMVNVQTFAAAGAAHWSLAWLAAWLLDPMVSLVLIAVLRAEQITARYQVETGVWVRRTKVFAFVATYTMNTWSSWATLHVSGIVLHSVPPVLVYMSAEVGPILRDRLTEAVLRAADTATVNTRAAHPAAPTSDVHTTGASGQVTTPIPPVHDVAHEPIHESASPARPTPAKKPRRKTPVKKARVLYPQYLVMAREALTPGTMPTAKWAQEVTGCSAGTSTRLARDLRDELAATTTTNTPPVFADAVPVTAERQVA